MAARFIVGKNVRLDVPFLVFNKLKINIFDLQGALILSTFVENNNIQLPDNLIDGVYLLEVTDEQKFHYTTRVLKKCF